MSTSGPWRIIGLSRGSVPCEFATRLAIDAGMGVVKVETEAGDPLRASASALFAYLAAGKQSVAVAEHDVRSTVLALAAGSHALVVDEWGRDVMQDAALSIPVIVAGERDGSALKGMPAGRSGEFLAFHASGLGYLTPRAMPGYPSGGPLCPQAHLTEFLCGLYAAIALFALLGRDPAKADQGNFATIGLTATALPLLRREAAAVLYQSAAPHRNERIWKVSPAEVHRCRDGWVFVDVIEDAQWVRLCEYIGRPDLADDPRYATREQRFDQSEALCAVLDAFFATQTRDCWKQAQASGVPVAPVNSVEDLRDDPHLQARGFWVPMATANGTPFRAPSTPLARLFRDPADTRTPRAPIAGEHTRMLVEQAAA